ncbi:MAG: Zn-dependent hydrolase [Chlorobiaceae bacterium]|nr:Zn-dependent hydrolase [Chlorobiaceae bacterium]MBA4309817.1 Zn-dependent hydrolase [Chlorobiaceae bacterium]
MNRRKFLKQSLFATGGLLLIPPFFSKQLELKAAPNRLKPTPNDWRDDELNITWIGHSTVLINFYGKIILTDPVLFDRVGIQILGMTYGPSRASAPALYIDEIPKPDLILLSHAHMDHMDMKTLSTLTNKYPNQIDCITAFNTSDVIEELEWKSIHEMDWKDEFQIHGINFNAIEVQHFGWRLPWERDRSKGYFSNGRSFNAYVLEKNGKKILFGGDTAMTDKFKNSGVQVDIAIMPIGAYNPWRKNHCNPEEALQMASEVNAKIFIPIHANTFKQGLEPIDEPLRWMIDSHSNYNLAIGIEEIGGTFTSKT